MSAATEIITDQTRTRAISLRWIINARKDLIWFVGSVASSYALLVLYVTGLLPLIPMVAAWAVLIDAPHVFGTLSHLLRSHGMENAQTSVARLALVFHHRAGDGLARFWLHILFRGRAVVYKKKNNDLAPVDNALDRLLLMFAFNYPFVAFIANDPSAMARVPPVLRIGVSAIATLLLVGTIVLGSAWLVRQIQRAWLAQPLNLPKHLLLAAAIPMHWIALMTPMPNKPIALVAILTIYHNLQYHRLIWFHNQKYTAGSADILSASARRSLAGYDKYDSPERRSLSALGSGKAANDHCSRPPNQIRPCRTNQPPPALLHRIRSFLRYSLSRPAPNPGLSRIESFARCTNC